ncbi:MAG: type II CAAX endopeptidase family protein [Ignavibacteriaceae bacterium]
MNIKFSEIIVALVLIPHLVNGFYDYHLSQYSLLLYAVVRVLTTALIPLTGMIILIKKCNYKAVDFGLVFSNNLITILGVILTVIILILFWQYFPVFYYQRINPLIVSLFPVNYFKMPNPKTISQLSFLLGIIFIPLFAGFFEEIYYRGILYKIFKERKTATFFIILIASGLFALSHWEAGIYYLLLTFTIAIFLTWFYAKYRTVLPLIIAHIFVDIYV